MREHLLQAFSSVIAILLSKTADDHEPSVYLVAEIKVKRLSFNFLLVLIPYLINSFLYNCS